MDAAGASEMCKQRALGMGLANVCEVSELDERLLKCKGPPLVILIKNGEESLAHVTTFLGAAAVPAAQAAMCVFNDMLIEFNAYDELQQEGEGEVAGYCSFNADDLKTALVTCCVGLISIRVVYACELFLLCIFAYSWPE